VRAAVKRTVERVEQARLPADLVARWRALPDGHSDERVTRFRRAVVPWMDATRRLDGTPILEVGTGRGTSTTVLAEQGAEVTGVDIDPEPLEVASHRLAALGLTADLVVGNGADLSMVAPGRIFPWIVFWAVLEHMTLEERIGGLRSAWARLGPGGLLTVIETPNRLWPFDGHTSRLPYFSWLPHDLAYRYSTHSDREGFGDRYTDGTGAEMEHFLRRGVGVSFHEFDLALGDHHRLPVASYLQGWWRQRDPVRRVARPLTRAARTERVLASYSPATDHAWFQPMLYLTLRKP